MVVVLAQQCGNISCYCTVCLKMVKIINFILRIFYQFGFFFFFFSSKRRLHTGETQVDGHSVTLPSSAPQNCQDLQGQRKGDTVPEQRGLGH